MQLQPSSTLRRCAGLLERQADQVCFVARPGPTVEVFDLTGASRLAWVLCAEPLRFDELVDRAAGDAPRHEVQLAVTLLIGAGLVELTDVP